MSGRDRHVIGEKAGAAKKLVMTALPLAIGFANGTYAQTPYGDAVMETEEVVVLGSRVVGRSSADLPVPVDTLTADAMENTGQTEVGRILQSLAPSFNFSSSAVSDGTDALRPATLRGLGPDQTLVLVNGKRRHQAALIHINTSVGRGTAGTDMNAIPAASIKKIEVLRDGAAAQYGSDAIAGVINIVLKDDSEGGRLNVTRGEYSEGDGETTNLDFNKGFSIGHTGFLNLTANYRDRGFTNRAGLHGSCLFSCTDADGDGVSEVLDEREYTASRETFRIGDAESEQYAFTLNGAFELGKGELYSFATYSSRDNESAAFFRHNGNTTGNTRLADGDAVIPAGFLPKINSDIEDISFNIGYRMQLNDDATMDVSYTAGRNTIDYVTSDSINASFANHLRFEQGLSSDEIRAAMPREADAYGLELGLQTLNVDYTHAFGALAFAAGGELRTDGYKVTAGEEYAYADYDTENGQSLYTGLGGIDAEVGIQGFGGIAPESEVDESRNVFSLYMDTEYGITDDAMVSAALRYDDYDDFGNTVNFKLAGNWAINDRFRIRGAASTGFRAPSMQQLYFNNISTQFVTNPDDPDGPQIAAQVGTFRNDSALAAAVGIPELKEEESRNYSVGFVMDPLDDLTVTVDYYRIDIEDRIVISGKLEKNLSDELSQALTAAGASSAQFFLNGADTETSGVDVVATYSGLSLADGDLQLTLAANFTETEVTDLFTPDSGAVSSLTPEQVFSEQDISIIEEWQPKDRISFTANYARGPFSVNLAFNRYGEYTVVDGGSQTYGAEVLTDLTLRYELDNGFAFSLGGNNIFDVTPDKNTIGNARNGTIVDTDGNIIVDSAGVFTYSRRSAPFGFNGAYFYGGVSYRF